MKRSIDLVLGALIIVILLPVILLSALLIRISGIGPVFFCQTRVGQHGKLFTMYKFRTMTVNHRGSSISIKGENRITPLGKYLRRYKIDELPELWNILKGDMSFVGPRPDVPGYADKLTGEDRNILKLKPGLTGAASLIYFDEEELLSKVSDPVEYNDKILYPTKVKLDLEYYYNRSFTKDLKIILKTIYRTLAMIKN